ncbi:CAP domain-containing protein [Streptomyces sp. WMMC1477]|uniref:CAP domain-containing protein n=1 Tax=Streptomyces sp. WMMC1477 TaxID=3015155 RepID=UPI0022B651A4|nr:CAP domain-containing protein [Streptomyces sp. WMMC1477]MCZ7433895.1 CAP domain-containing protein [Streptomyces sp. WMMC1477]
MTPLRAGLLAVSATAVLGTVAVGAGVVPGLGEGFGLLDGEPGTARTDSASSRTPGASEGAGGRDDTAASRGEERRSPSPTPTPEPSTTPEDEPTPSAEPTEEKPREEEERSAKPAPETSAPAKPTPAPKPPAPTADPPSPPGDSGAHSAAEARVLTLVNQERSRAGCSPLRADASLARLAGDHSADMARRGYFSHTDPDGRDPWDRAEEDGVTHLGGENIARGQADAEAVMRAWMDSPGHRKNILNCGFTSLGVGAHFAGGGPWWTQSFGY